MPKIIEQLPDGLRPYSFHGLDIQWRKGTKDATCECLFCGAEGKFGIVAETSQYRCVKCSASGNAGVFVRELLRLSEESTTDYEELCESRGLLFPESLVAWGVCRSVVNGDWLIPGYNAEGKTIQAYRYTNFGKADKRRAVPTPTFGHQLFHCLSYDPTKPVIDLLEGPWDGLALYEILGKVKEESEGVLQLTANARGNLLQRRNVLAIPGCGTFPEAWVGLFADKVVNLWCQNDHPGRNPKTGEPITPASYGGMQRIARMLMESDKPPLEINYCYWGDEGYDLAFPHGHDIRDSLISSGSTLEKRLEGFVALENRLRNVPASWLGETSGSKKKAGKSREELELIPCSDWKTLTDAWKNALTWIDGLEVALSTMLASVTSTMAVGDQLWIQVISPPSCLHEDTLIHDPVDGTTKTVKERWESQKEFSVYTRKADGEFKIGKAEKPFQYPKSPMYEVTFESGRSLKVTAGHRIWDGSSFVSLQHLYEKLQANVSCPLPTISGFDLLVQTRGVQHLKQRVEDYQCDCYACSYLCGEQLRSEGGNDLDVVPSHSDAQDIDLLDQRKGDSGREYICNCFSQSPSLCNSGDPNLLEPQKDEKGLLTVEECVELVPLKFQNALRFGLCFGQPSSDQLLAYAQSQSTSKLKQYPVLGGPNKLQLENYQQYQQLSAESYPLDKLQQRNRSSLEASVLDVESLFDEGCFPASGTFEQPIAQLSLFDSTPQSYDSHLDKVEQANHDDFDPKQQPRQSPLDKQKGVNERTLPEVDRIVKIEFIGELPYYDFHVPGTENYWAEGFVHHNTGKSVLCEAISSNKKYVLAKSTIRGFHSGFGNGDGEDNSLLKACTGKTLVTKDGDTLLQSPNLGQILAEARDVYDTVSRTHYRNKQSKNYEGVRMTWILCGTSSLLSLDTSELGERFLKCIIMDGIDDDLEDEILLGSARSAARNVSLEAGKDANTKDDPTMLTAVALTGGYVDYLRKNASDLLSAVEISHDALWLCTRFGKFVAYMRARPSVLQEEHSEREFASRLVKQITRLAFTTAVVLNKTSIDEEVLRRVKKITLDTSRGVVLTIMTYLYYLDEEGCQVSTMSLALHKTDQEIRTLLKFLRHIGAVEIFQPEGGGTRKAKLYRITKRLEKLYKEVMTHGKIV